MSCSPRGTDRLLRLLLAMVLLPLLLFLRLPVFALLGWLQVIEAAPTTQKHWSTSLDPYPTKPRNVFQPDGTFKITIFSDLHFGENPWDDWGPVQDINSIALMKTVLADEIPDYVVLNGDLITGENAFRENSTSLINEIMGPLNGARVHFSSVHGNHDNQVNITHLEEIIREQEICPLSYTRIYPGANENGVGTYWVPVYPYEDAASPALILWFFDSRGGFTAGKDSKPVPDWVDASVADWIVRETLAMEKTWGPASARQALAFVHIPPHVIQDVQSHLDPEKNPGLNEDYLGVGSAQATVSADDAGADDPFWDALNTHVVNLRAIISGHDHGDEWCAREPSKDVVFCFDKHSGYGGYDGTPSWGHGVRNIVFSSTDVDDDLETWIRYENGTVEARVVLNHEYGR